MAGTPHRAFWSDARFLIGLVLVFASIGGVWWVISSARQTTTVLVAAQTLLPGQPVTADDVRGVDVALGAARDAYLADGDLAAGMVATRTVAAGELLHVDAVGQARALASTVVVVRSTIDVPTSVASGDGVDLWTAPADGDGGFGAPRILVANAVVSQVLRGEGIMGTRGQSVELVIPRADVAATLAAVSDGSALSVVPTGGTP